MKKTTTGTVILNGVSTAFAFVTWKEVIAVLEKDRERDVEGYVSALTRYRSAGFTADDFAESRLAREAMSDALTRTEDFIESRSASCDSERARIREVRRRLEWELWP